MTILRLRLCFELLALTVRLFRVDVWCFEVCDYRLTFEAIVASLDRSGARSQRRSGCWISCWFGWYQQAVMVGCFVVQFASD